MSQSSSPTIINNNNVTIYSNSINNGLNALGLQSLPVGQSVPLITQQALGKMLTALVTKFNNTFSANPLPPGSDTDGGYMGPMSAITPGQAPACAVNQITMDFANWGLSTTTTIPTTLAMEITQEIVNQGGQPGFQSGTYQINSAESLYWMVGYLSINISQTETGVLYVFAATEGINL